MPRRSDVAAIEQELTLLVRTIEAVRRHRSYPIEPAQYLHMRTLMAEGPQTVANLAARLRLDSSTVTRQIAAMEAAGLISRAPHPSDSRSHLISPTDQGRARTEEMRLGREERIARLVAEWRDDDRRDLARLMGKFSRGLLAQIGAETVDSD